MEDKGGGGKRKCLCCKQVFVPDPRIGNRQRFCSDLKCQAASKKRSQKRWCAKNADYWKGQDQVRRVQAWRKTKPGSATKISKGAAPAPLQEKINPTALQDVRLPEDPLLVGLISSLIKSTLQDEIAAACRDLVAKGSEILQKQIVGREPRLYGPQIVTPRPSAP